MLEDNSANTRKPSKLHVNPLLKPAINTHPLFHTSVHLTRKLVETSQDLKDITVDCEGVYLDSYMLGMYDSQGHFYTILNTLLKANHLSNILLIKPSDVVHKTRLSGMGKHVKTQCFIPCVRSIGGGFLNLLDYIEVNCDNTRDDMYKNLRFSFNVDTLQDS